MRAAHVLAQASRALQQAGISDAPGDARRLLAWALGINAARLVLYLQDDLPDRAAAAFADAITARSARHPVSHIIGGRWFYSHWFRITPDVLDPRPETEHLVQAALAKPFERVLDLGTGSGCILLTLLKETDGTTGVGTDISPAALAVARRNAGALGVEKRAGFAESNWFSTVATVATVEGRFDLIVSNPPYIGADEMAALTPEVRDHEPHIALTPGGDGLDAYRKICADISGHLTPGGRFIVEIGPCQAQAVGEVMAQAGLVNIQVTQDLDGRDRVVQAENRKKPV